MPVYQYQGQHYDISETDPVKAKERILAYTSKQTSVPVTDTPVSSGQSTLEKVGQTALDVVDVVASTPAFIAAAGTGLTAAVFHAADPRRPAGQHFGAANKVFEAVMEEGGNPIRKALTGVGAIDTTTESTSVVTDAFNWLGEKIEKASEVVGEATGSLEMQEAAKFGLTTVGPPLVIKGAHGTVKGVGKAFEKTKEPTVAKTVVEDVVKEPSTKRIQPDESVSEVLARKKAEEAGEIIPKTPKEEVLDIETQKMRAEHTAEMQENVSRMEQMNKEVLESLPEAERIKYEAENEAALALEEKYWGKDKLLQDEASANIKEFITSEQTQFGTRLQGVTDILAKSANVILAKTREAELFAKAIEKLVPNADIRVRMTRAKEAHLRHDEILTDLKKEKVLFGETELAFIERQKTDPDALYQDKGMQGRLSWLKESLGQLKTAVDTSQGKARALQKTFDNFVAKENLGKLTKEEQIKKFEEMIQRLEYSFEKLKSLPSEEHAIPVLKMVEERLKERGEQAKKVGLIDAVRNNYIPHVLDWSKSTLNPKQKADLLARLGQAPKESKLVRDFAEHRHYEFLRDLEQIVEGTGVIVHTDIAKIVLAYEKSMQTAIIHKALLDFLKVNKDAEGKPWLMTDGAEARAARYVPFEGVGSQVLKEYRVHPDLADSMGFLFRQTDPSIIVRTLGGISHLTKALNTVGSLFHMKSLFEAGLLTDPKLMAKEIGKEVLFKVFKSGEGSGARQALKAFKEGGNEAMTNLYLREGLVISVEDIQRSIVADTGMFLDRMASKLAPEGKQLELAQHITEPLDRLVIQRLNKWTWDYAHAGQKLNVAFHLHEKMARKNPDMSDAAIAKEVSGYVNNTFGGLNWLEIANSVNNKYLRAASLKMAGIAGREWAQIVMFAPDWTVSTLRAFTTALPKELSKPQNWELRKGIKGVVNPRTQGDLARRYVITTALAYATLINAINYMVAGTPIWENRDPTRIQFTDGTSMQAAKHSMEAVHWMMAPDKTLGNKLGFWPKALFVSTTGVAYPSPDAPKLKDTSLFGRAKAVGTLGVPFPISSAIQAPKGQGVERAVSSMLGAPIYGIGKEDLKKAIKQGKKDAAEKRRKMSPEEKRQYIEDRKRRLGK